MQFSMTKEWLQRKLREMEDAGIEEITCIPGIEFIPAGIKVRAKMRCNAVQKTGSERHPNVNIQLGAVYSNDPDSENRAFANATPSASVNMNIDPARPAAEAFTLGADYYVDFIPCGIPERRYIGDGIDPLESRVVVTNRDGTVECYAVYEGKNSKLTFSYDDFVFSASPYGNGELREAGFTHWRYLRDVE